MPREPLHLCGKALARLDWLIVQKWTAAAGLEAAQFAGHSLRRGAISTGGRARCTSPASSSSLATPRSRASKSMSSSMSYATITR